MAYWPIALFWRMFGVFPVNAEDGNRNSNTSLPVLSTVMLSASCVYVLFVGPAVVCRIGEKCSSDSIRVLKEMYPNIANVTSMLARIALLYSVTVGYDKYRETLGCYETYSPTTVAEAGRYRVFTAAAVCSCLLLVVPVKVLRLWMLWTPDGDDTTLIERIVFYALIYVQNVTMCCSESQFVDQCFLLYCKLKTVNNDVVVLSQSAGLAHFSRHSRYASNASAADAATPDAPDVAVAEEELQDASDSVAATADAVEALRIRHWLLREAIGCLNNVFGVQLGMSVCAVCMMSFFDIYYETFHLMGKYPMSGLITYCWMLHYALRYMGIILMSHYTTKQVSIEPSCRSRVNIRLKRTLCAIYTYIVLYAFIVDLQFFSRRLPRVLIVFTD